MRLKNESRNKEVRTRLGYKLELLAFLVRQVIILVYLKYRLHFYLVSTIVFCKYLLHFMFLVYFTIAFVLCYLVKFSLGLRYIQGVWGNDWVLYHCCDHDRAIPSVPNKATGPGNESTFPTLFELSWRTLRA